MWQRKASLLVAWAIAFTTAPFLFRAAAQCNPASGSSANDTIICNGDDADGVNTGSGSDQVNLVSGTVKDTIVSEGGSLLIIVDGGALDTSAKGSDAIHL